MTENCRPSVARFVLRTSCLVLLVGCGGGYDAAVTGRVTLDGEPLTKGMVMFHPVGSGAAPLATIQEDGTFRLKTGAESSLAAGEYIATIKALSGEPSPTMTTEQIEALFLVPKSYGDAETSSLRVQVEPGKNEIELELVST